MTFLSEETVPESVAVFVPGWNRMFIITRFSSLVNDTTDPDAAIDKLPLVQYEITGNYLVELGALVAHTIRTP